MSCCVDRHERGSGHSAFFPRNRAGELSRGARPDAACAGILDKVDENSGLSTHSLRHHTFFSLRSLADVSVADLRARCMSSSAPSRSRTQTSIYRIQHREGLSQVSQKAHPVSLR